MKNKTNPTKRVKKVRMVPFYFTHTKETQEFALQTSEKENLAFAVFCRSMFNAGIQATYGVKMVNNMPVEKTN